MPLYRHQPVLVVSAD